MNGVDLSSVKPKEIGIQIVTSNGPTGFVGAFSSWGSQTSTGERQAAAIDRALSGESKVLLFDEPFSHLDAGRRDICIEKIRRDAVSKGRIVLFASADFDLLTIVSDSIAMLNASGLSEDRPPQAFYDDPPTAAAARLTGDNNLFEARRLTSSDSDLPEFHTIDGGHRIFAFRADKKRLAPIDQNSILAIRPEQVVMSMGNSFPEDNLLRAVVTNIKFRGPTSLIEFDAGGLKLETRVFKVVGLKVGDECMLGLPPHRIIILNA